MPQDATPGSPPHQDTPEIGYNSLARLRDTVNPAIAAAVGLTKLTIWYGGGPRLIQPHAYGLSKKGKELLKAFQVSGHSNSGHPTGWKTFRVDRITAILPADDQPFQIQPGWTAAPEIVTTYATA